MGFFFLSCSCHLEACNKFYGPGFIEHRRRGIEVPCLNLRLMFWKEQALSDECFDHSLPTFWRESNARVPNLCLLGGHRALVPAAPLSIVDDICLFPSLSLVKEASLLLGRHLGLAPPVTVALDAAFLGRGCTNSSSSPNPPSGEGESCEPAAHLLRSVSLCQCDSC